MVSDAGFKAICTHRSKARRREPRGRILYKKVLLAYDGSIEGRRALREGAKLAQFCGAEVFLLAVVEISSGTVTLEGGFAIPVEDQIATYEAILAEGVERLKAIGFSPTARLGMGAAGQEIAGDSGPAQSGQRRLALSLRSPGRERIF